MPVPVVLPQISVSMEEGTVLRWLVDDGARVTSGQVIVEVETDKANTELEATATGILRIRTPEGETVPVQATLAEIEEA